MAPLKFITVIILGFLFFSNCTEGVTIKICNGQDTQEACVRRCDPFCKFFRHAVGACELSPQNNYTCCCKYPSPPLL
ncbi:hypothetical protein Lalb_Chr22g0358581 [Lupinus albus]|uniref:Knottin, scorpion toxin n=1 Tax=Lupinus albus TaxID=3870 RepID=A0A6A4NIT1_LUPAL|nr:hypothetical protein Lalb_Chr22g0358581 [Lupinus albus]